MSQKLQFSGEQAHSWVPLGYPQILRSPAANPQPRLPWLLGPFTQYVHRTFGKGLGLFSTELEGVVALKMLHAE